MTQDHQSLPLKPVLAGSSPAFKRDYYFLYLSGIANWPENIELPEGNFGLFLACDARELTDEMILGVAKTALNQGLVYLCAWGPDCERVHDLFDLADIRREIRVPEQDSNTVVMTTWHAEESLKEAIWYFKVSAYGAGRFENCQTWLAVNVGQRDLSSEIMELLKNEDWLREV
jgi:hypothetical protein